MKISIVKLFRLAAALACLAAIPARADSITNSFNTGVDFVTQGVVGTMWDGIYLGFGDVTGGNDAGDVGYTLQANETAFPGFLTVQDSQTDWSGPGDDGFFLFKVVAGDFDFSVDNAQPFQNPGYHFAGIMARAYATGPNWGAPFGGSENWVNIMRFEEFGIGEDIRYAINGADHDTYATVGETAADLATDRYLRITRAGDLFSFYTKTNATDAWALAATLARPDLAGVAMQVGIADTTFGGSQPTSYFTDFELTGTNVLAAAPAPANATGLTTNAGPTSVTFSWTPGAGSTGSILLLRKNNPQVLTQKPINGYTYHATNVFGSGDNLGGGIYAVYAGTSNSVTVTGLGSTNNNYSAAVYSYSGSGSSIVYGTGPATATAVGTGVPLGIIFSLSPTSIAVGGVAVPTLAEYFSTGDTNIVPATNAVWTSSNDAIASTTPDGVVDGVAIGSAAVSVSYAGFSATNTVTVHAPAFTESFGAPHNYATGGLAGTAWDGLYVKAGDVLNSSYAGAPLNASAFDAGITTNNVLTIDAANSGWEGTQDNGPFLFKNVPGDFEASVHITDYQNTVAYLFVGLQARAYALADGTSPSGPAFSENHINWWRFDQFGVTTSARDTINGNNDIVNNQNDGENTDYWLLMTRIQSTNFYFFKKALDTDPWMFVPDATIVRPDLAGVPMQVGVAQGTYTGGFGEVQFDSFSLDAANIAGGVPPSASTGLSITWDATFTQATLTWTGGTNSDGSADTSFAVMRAGGPVNAQPYFGILTTANSVFGQGTDLGSGTFVVFRGVGNTVTVTGLTPGVEYYAAVYGYSGSSTTKSFNEAGSAAGQTPPVSFTGITASLPGNGIPAGGIGIPQVLGILPGGALVDVTTSSQITSGNTNIIVSSHGILTGLAPGKTTNVVTFETYSSSLVATVRAPSYTDHFSVSNDFVADGVASTTWDGVYAHPGAIPDFTYVSDPAAAIFSADANVTSNGVLTVTSENVGWEFGQDDGFFLFKYVPGDFQMAVHINSMGVAYDGADILGYDNPGLLARAYALTNAGAPYNTNGFETWVSFTRFDQFAIGTYARYTLDNNTTRSTQPNGFNGAGTTSDTNLWLLIVRQNQTNFLFYQRAQATDPWAPTPTGTTYSLAALAGLPLQVGILAGGFNSGNTVTDGFDSFMLDQPPATRPTLTVTASGGNIVISWPAGGGFTLQSSAGLNPASWQPVATAPVVANGVATVTLPATGAGAFFRLTN